MHLLILSSNNFQGQFNILEEGSVAFANNIRISSEDETIIKNDLLNTYIFGLVTEKNGLAKVLCAKLVKLESDGNGRFKLLYNIIHIISSKAEVENFCNAFPYAFKQEGDVTISRSMELMKLMKYIIGENGRSKSNSNFKTQLINSDAYRLLSSKSQIYKNDQKYGVHSKLSHSIKVINIANEIGSKLQELKEVEINYNLIENIAMSMNIGHVPFGYVGEMVINEILQGNVDIIPNTKLLGLKYFKHNLQSARILYHVDNIASDSVDDLNVVAGVISHAKIGFDLELSKNKENLSKFLKHYYIGVPEFLDNYISVENNIVTASTIESQIVAVADEIAQSAYDVELAVRMDSVDSGEIITRLKLISEITGEYHEYALGSKNERHASSKEISLYIENYLIKSAVNSYKFEIDLKDGIRKVIEFSDEGRIILDIIKTYFQSKLLLSKDVRIFDYKAKNIMQKLFEVIYNDINLLPIFYKNRIIEEYQKAGLVDINIVLCFISFKDGMEYLKYILNTDLSKVRNKQEISTIIIKREIIIQVIIDYFTYLSDYDAEQLYQELLVG